jgi:autotransporter-associated beta strand protein
MLSSFTGDSVGGNVIMTFGGTGDIEITGAMGSPVSNYGITKTGPGTLLFGSGVTGFARATVVNDGTLDLNNLTYNPNALTLGGAASTLGAQIVTGAAGTLNLGAGLTFSNSGTPAGARITGNVGIGALPQPFNIGNTTDVADLTIDGPITGSAGSSITKSGTGTLRLTGAGNTLPGLFSVTGGVLELAKSGGDAIGTGGLATSVTGIVRLAAAEQIHNGANISIGAADDSFLELGNFTETVGPLTITQTDANDYSGVKTGATGILVLNGNLSLNNNSNSFSADGREVLVTGSGSENTPATDGTLDLGGATRTIHVATTTVGANEQKANATIETRIINGGILKTGPRKLFLTNPDNTFAGGLQIAEGTVSPGSAGSLGLGPVAFTNAPGTAASIDFGTASSTVANLINTGTGDFILTYAAPAPNVLTLSGGINLQQDLTIDVVNGSVENGTPTEVKRAVVNVSGLIDDAAGTFGLIKVGDGMLKLAAGNTFGGGTLVQRGILSLAADSSLGDSTAPLTLDGGCLAASNSFTLSRNLAVGPNGGSLRAESSRTMELAGSLDWGGATTGVDGPARVIVSGSTSGSGNLVIGAPIAFAAGTIGQLTWDTVLTLQGSAALPTGNLSLVNQGVLALGNGDFTRPLGTGPGEVQVPGATGGGWAAVGANRVVNLGGSGATLSWGQTSPPFLDGGTSPAGGAIGSLVLGSFWATHTVDFQNPLNLDHSETFTQNYRVICRDGAAAIDGRLSGDITYTDPAKRVTLYTTGEGTLEISGDILGNVGLQVDGQGTTILSGSNDLTQGIIIFSGTAVLANNASMGSPEGIAVLPDGAHLDASALTVPVTLGQPGQILVEGLLTGDVLVNGTLEGYGEITGDVTVPAGSSLDPEFNGTLEIGGDLTLASGGWMNFELYGTAPEMDHNRLRVSGTVNLAGDLSVYGSDSLAVDDEVVVLLNDGSDPVVGTFAGLPEGAILPIAPGLAIQITYLANGDGGTLGNDIGFTVIEDAFSADLWLTGNAPLIVEPGAEIVIPFTIQSLGPASLDGANLQINLPTNADFVSSDPAGTVDNDVLTIPLPLLFPFDFIGVELRLTAPAVASSVTVNAELTGFSDPFPWDNSFTGVTAVLPGGSFELESFTSNSGAGTVTLGFDALDGVTYVLQSSTTLKPNEWSNDLYFIGDGLFTTISPTIDEPKEFFRVGIVPYGTFNGGGVEGAQ